MQGVYYYYFLLTCFFLGGAPLSQLAKSRTRTGLLIASSLVRISPGAQYCVLEQDTLPSMLSTGSTEMTEKLLTGTESLKHNLNKHISFNMFEYLPENMGMIT